MNRPMKSFRDFVRQEVPLPSPISMRSLAQKYKLPSPVSLKRLLTLPTSTKTATQSGTFTRNNCPSGQVGSSVSYSQSATATARSGYSQADADQKAFAAAETAALAAVNSGGQAYANQHGICMLPSPTLESYDTKTFALKGKNFTPSHQIWIRMVVLGTVTLFDSQGNATQQSDSRTNFPLYLVTADSAGSISVVVDTKAVLPSITYGDIIYYGVIKGSTETLYISAHDGRQNAAGTDYLWSNTLAMTVVG